ncbi:MAG: helix-turn-helix domain-containing protein [Phycisphaerales bacterium]
MRHERAPNLGSEVTGAGKLLVNSATAAVMLSMSPRALWQWTHDGKIPFVRLGRRVLYDMRDLIAFIDRAKRETTPADANAAATTNTSEITDAITPSARRARPLT